MCLAQVDFNGVGCLHNFEDLGPCSWTFKYVCLEHLRTYFKEACDYIIEFSGIFYAFKAKNVYTCFAG